MLSNAVGATEVDLDWAVPGQRLVRLGSVVVDPVSPGVSDEVEDAVDPVEEQHPPIGVVLARAGSSLPKLTATRGVWSVRKSPLGHSHCPPDGRMVTSAVRA
jgi:hypothetical protein